MNFHKLLRLITAIPLGIMAFIFMIFVPSAHVTMCMACAIGYSIGLPMDKYRSKIDKIVSFFAGGILFYTVYAGTTPLLIQWFSGFMWDLGAWVYHFIINFALLVMFITRRDRVDHILGGIEVFMIGSPIMFLIQKFLGRGLEGEESAIPFYIAIGVIILVFHQLVARFATNFYPKLLLALRRLIMLSLIIYAVLQLAVLPVILNSPNPSPNPGPQQNTQTGEIIFNQDSVSVIFHWPESRQGISNEESEIYVLNQSNQLIEVTSPSLTHSTNNETFKPASEGWEVYASQTSQEKLDRVIIYNSRPEKSLILKPGQLGKLHYHFLFSDTFAQGETQFAQISMDLKAGNKTHKIDTRLTRTVRPKQHFNSTAVHPVEEQIKKYGPGPEAPH